MATIVKNDGKTYGWDANADQSNIQITLSWDGKEKRAYTHLASWRPAIAITHDFRVEVGCNGRSDPMDPEVLKQRLADELGLEFQFDEPHKRVQPIEELSNWETIMKMAGYGKKACDYEHTDGLVWLITGDTRNPNFGPYLLSDVKKAANRLIADARKWLRQTFPSLSRSLSLTEYQVVTFVKVAQKASIQRFHVGETAIDVPVQEGSYFGSGGAWGFTRKWGDLTVENQPADSWDNGFCSGGKKRVIFDQGPAAFYTAAGDEIGNGRTFYKTLYVAE